jgi:hypothetical protein
MGRCKRRVPRGHLHRALLHDGKPGLEPGRFETLCSRPEGRGGHGAMAALPYQLRPIEIENWDIPVEGGPDDRPGSSTLGRWRNAAVRKVLSNPIRDGRRT